MNTKLVQLKADSDQADIDLVSADAALEDKINTLQDTVGANKGAVDAAQAARNAQSVVQAAADKVVLDTLAALKKVQDAHAVFVSVLFASCSHLCALLSEPNMLIPSHSRSACAVQYVVNGGHMIR